MTSTEGPTPLQLSVMEVQRVADLVHDTQPIWSGHLNRVLTAIAAERARADALHSEVSVQKAMVHFWKKMDEGRKQEAEAAEERAAAMEQGMAWLVECVIRERGGTPDPLGWIAKAKKCAAQRQADNAQLQYALEQSEQAYIKLERALDLIRQTAGQSTNGELVAIRAMTDAALAARRQG